MFASPSTSHATFARWRAIVSSSESSLICAYLSLARKPHSSPESCLDSITMSSLSTTSRAIISYSFTHPTFLSLQLMSWRAARFILACKRRNGSVSSSMVPHAVSTTSRNPSSFTQKRSNLKTFLPMDCVVQSRSKGQWSATTIASQRSEQLSWSSSQSTEQNTLSSLTSVGVSHSLDHVYRRPWRPYLLQLAIIQKASESAHHPSI